MAGRERGDGRVCNMTVLRALLEQIGHVRAVDDGADTGSHVGKGHGVEPVDESVDRPARPTLRSPVKISAGARRAVGRLHGLDHGLKGDVGLKDAEEAIAVLPPGEAREERPERSKSTRTHARTHARTRTPRARAHTERMGVGREEVPRGRYGFRSRGFSLARASARRAYAGAPACHRDRAACTCC